VRVAHSLVKQHGIQEKNIIVLSQYRAQCHKLKEKLTERGLHNVNVSTVVASQGSEWDYVILSTVRSLPQSELEVRPTQGWITRNLGFITDKHQINVALTRAKLGLIIIGNKHLLRCDSMWRNMLWQYKNQGYVVDAHNFMSPRQQTLYKRDPQRQTQQDSMQQ